MESSSSSAGLPSKRRPSCLPNDGQVDLLSDTVTIPDRAARKEIERQRLRKLLNQGRKKRRRLTGEKLSHRHDNPSLHPIYAVIPRKSRSVVGSRRKGQSWRSIGFDPQDAKSSPSSVQDEIEIEIEFEIAEVLYGLKKQVSSSDEHEPVIDDMEKEENQSLSVQGCTDTPKAESISIDKAVLKQEVSTAEEGSNLASDGDNLTSEMIHASVEETKSKQPEKFVIDLNEPPPMDSSLEGDGPERLNSDPKAEIREEVKSVTEPQLPRKMETRDEMWDIVAGIESKRQKAYSRPSHPIHMPLRSGHLMAGPLIFPLSQNQTLIANQPGHARFRYPIVAPCLSVSPGNVCTNTSPNGERMHSSGGKSAPPVSFLDRQLHSSQILYPIQLQQQRQHPFTAQTISSSSQRNMTRQILYPRHSPNVASSGGCEWRYAERQSEEMHNSTPGFSFPSSTESSSMAQNHVVSQGFLDRPNSGSQFLLSDHRLQHRNSEMIQRMNQADSILGQSGFILKSRSAVSPASMGAKVFDTSVTTQNCKLAFAKQNALSARIHLSNSNHLGVSRENPASVWLQNQQQQMSQTTAASQLKGVQTVNSQHQPPISATLTNDFSIFAANLYDKSSHSLRQ